MVKENKNKDQNSDIKDKLVAINRVTKVVKGGRRFGFAALVVAGDELVRWALATVKLKRCLKQ